MNMDLQKIIELLKAQMPNATDIPGGVALDLSLLAGETKTVLVDHTILKKDNKHYSTPVIGNAYVVFLTRKKR